MKNKVIWGVISLFLCVLSGIVGAYSMLLLQEHKTNGETLQVHRLELIDAHKGVRAEFFVEDDGSVFLRMLSKENASVVELGVNENPGPYKQYTPSGSLTIRDGTGTPAIRLRTLDKGEAALSFSSTGNPDLVGVGYSHYGDVIDGHDRGMWGLQIAGPNHQSTGVNVFAEDGVLKGATVPLEPPPNIGARPAKRTGNGSVMSSPSSSTSLHEAGHSQAKSAH